jgi:acetate---CoA ligase (ADP-forming)
MLESLKGPALLSTFRGQAGVVVDAFIHAICRLSELADELKDVVDQIDWNPLIVATNGIMAADALADVQPLHRSKRPKECAS